MRMFLRKTQGTTTQNASDSLRSQHFQHQTNGYQGDFHE